MADCEVLATCIFFNDQMESRPATVEVMKNTYCRRSHDLCARYMVMKALGREAVPRDLFPSDKVRAEKLIKKQAKL